MKNWFSRRFILTSMGLTAFAGPALWLPRRSQSDTSPVGQWQKSRVVIARKEGLLQANNTLDSESVGKLIDQAMCALGDKKDPLDVWRSFFSPVDRISIKVNTLGGRMLSPHPELAIAIAERLTRIGVPAQNILIWDRSLRELKTAGFTPESIQGKASIIATDMEGIGYERQPEISGSIGSCFSRIVSKGCTAMINLGVLKDHDLSGTSVAMKNLFGLIHNPNRYHFDVYKDPYLPDLCLHPYVKNKLRLTICDALRGQFNGGPAYSPKGIWEFGGILVAADAVALDAVGAHILNQKRIENKLPSFKEAGREPLYIQVAEEKKIGWADPAHIELKEVTI